MLCGYHPSHGCAAFLPEQGWDNSLRCGEQEREATGDLGPLVVVTLCIAAGGMLCLLPEGGPKEHRDVREMLLCCASTQEAL